MTSHDEYLETWFATIMLAVSRQRGGYAKDLARACDCSQTTFNKYVQMLIDSGEICRIAYGTATYPDNRYYVLSDATKEFCEPVQSMLEWSREKMETARAMWLSYEFGSREHTKHYEEYMAMYRIVGELNRRLELMHRVAIRVRNS